MSKQSEAKARQGYVSKAVLQVCRNCASFKFDSGFHNEDLHGKRFPKEFNLRCEIGGFAVKKMGTCDEFSGKSNEETNPTQPES
jgi:hypothetical protein